MDTVFTASIEGKRQTKSENCGGKKYKEARTKQQV